jgi:multidrug resistance protein
MMLAPSVPQVLETFRPDGGDKSLGSFCVTAYMLGFCFGPIALAPMTDLYGRTSIYRLAAVFFLLFTMACALSPTLEALIIFRFFAGCFGGTPMAIGGAVVADMYPPGERSKPMAFYAAGTMLGPTIGPVLGGVITGSLGWRWVFRFATILVSVYKRYFNARPRLLTCCIGCCCRVRPCASSGDTSSNTDRKTAENIQTS